MSDPIEELLTAYSPQVRDLALRLRALVLELQPDAVEQVDTADKLIGYGKGRKMASLVCVIIPYRNWVNLGFARGTELPDPHGRLIGSGKHARHVKVASTEDIDPAVLRPLLEAAWAKLSVQGASHSALNRKGAWMRAIISVSDKRGIVELAQQLAEIGGTGFELYSTGGTKAALEQGGVAVKSISELTNFPEIMDGRVKTLHPAVYSGILARRDKAEHMAALANLGLPTIDLVVVNLYPFVETIHQPQTDLETAIENIDIGGPAMIRAAAKNHESVIVLVDPADYAAVVAELRQGGVSPATRRQLAAKAYQHTASYDTYIAQYLRGANSPPGQPLPLPEEFSVSLRQVEEMRYGENPHQRAAVYADSLGNPIGTLIGNLRQLNGKQLSYNNILDADAALEIVRDFAAPTVVIIKHNNPCGLASGDDLRDNYARALAGDPVSAYGGIVGVNRPVDAALAEDIAGTFYEVVIAPSFSNAAVDTLARKKNLRVL
ncbi:MAG: bifunctional phosphoribosylaminoimidazolecarboxamide formyltransferase/IMP cyclohydrolase PurH, partial [Candidatus Chloroheliales bacterium]